MKTKEEILKKHIPSQFDWLKKTDPKLIDNILKSMEEYANRQLQLAGVSNSLEHTTRIVKEEDDFIGCIDVTECCKIGPITNENYCPKCGKQIIKQ